VIPTVLALAVLEFVARIRMVPFTSSEALEKFSACDPAVSYCKARSRSLFGSSQTCSPPESTRQFVASVTR
jgi:hypothetical protein